MREPKRRRAALSLTGPGIGHRWTIMRTLRRAIAKPNARASRCCTHLDEIATLREQVHVLAQALARKKADDEADAVDDRTARDHLRRELLDLRASASDRQIRGMGPDLFDAVIEFLE